jgi:acyl-CoA thioesterase I
MGMFGTIFSALVALVAAPAMAAAATIHIVAFGDSSTAGSLVPPEEAYPAQLQAALRAKGHDVQVHNSGVPGETTAGALRRFNRAIVPQTNIAIVEFGINDLRGGVAIQIIEENIAKMVRALHARRIQVLVIGVLELDLSAVAAANGALYAQWTFPPGRYRAHDGDHFSGEGYAILVDRIMPAVETLIARAKSSAHSR